MAKTIADLLVDTLVAQGVERIYGVAGDSLNGITDSIRRQERVRWVHVRHEETAAFAAGADAHLTGGLAVCAGSCGPGNLHLINGLYDCHRSRVPVLAIAAQIPSHEIGSGYFQETRPEHLFAQCSHYCELVSQPEQMPRVLEIAMQTALSRRGVAVIALPGDVALRDAVEQQPRLHFPQPTPRVCPAEDEIATLAKILNEATKITILGGAGCAGDCDLRRLIENLGQRSDFVLGRTHAWCRLRKMQPRLLFDRIAQGDISRQGNHRNPASRECGLHGNLQDPGHLLGLRNQFTIVAALREEVFRAGLLKISAADFIAWNLRRDGQDRNTATVTVVEPVD